MCIFAMMGGGLLAMGGPMVEARDAGIYRSFKINGVPALSILTVPMVTTVFQVLVVTAIITLSGPLFKGTLPANWGGFLLVTLVMAFSFSAIGALIGVVSTDSRSTVLYSQLIFLPSILLGGLMIPIDVLPQSVRAFSGLLPTTYAMQAILGYAYHQKTVYDPQTCLIVLIVGGLLAIGLAIYLFNWDSRNQTRRGHPLLALIALLPYIAGIFLK
jgi:ABC-2 type transport system permease protein